MNRRMFLAAIASVVGCVTPLITWCRRPRGWTVQSWLEHEQVAMGHREVVVRLKIDHPDSQRDYYSGYARNSSADGLKNLRLSMLSYIQEQHPNAPLAWLDAEIANKLAQVSLTI